MPSQKLQSYLDWCCNKFLSYRPRSIHEVRQYLEKKLIQKKITKRSEENAYIEKMIHDLVNRNILNDDEFIAWWIDDRTHFKPRGEKGLKSELMAKGVDNNVIENYLSQNPIDEPKIIKEILKDTFLYRSRTNKKEWKEKFTKKLMRRGFQYNAIKNAIEELDEEE